MKGLLKIYFPVFCQKSKHTPTFIFLTKFLINNQEKAYKRKEKLVFPLIMQ